MEEDDLMNYMLHDALQKDSESSASASAGKKQHRVDSQFLGRLADAADLAGAFMEMIESLFPG